MSENLVNDWELVQKCFAKLRNVTLDAQLDNSWVLTIEGKMHRFPSPSNRTELVSLAAAIMKPRQDTKRLREQINFVCFGVV